MVMYNVEAKEIIVQPYSSNLQFPCTEDDINKTHTKQLPTTTGPAVEIKRWRPFYDISQSDNNPTSLANTSM